VNPAPVEHIPPANTEPNPQNPGCLFDEEPMKILQEPPHNSVETPIHIDQGRSAFSSSSCDSVNSVHGN
jgi:hypothetical protein